MAERIRRWRLRARTAMTVLATGALVVAGAVAGPEQAEAASTTLCSGTAYTSCTSQGYPDYGYGINSSTSYWNQIAGHNCTNYVAYRLIQNGLSTTKPWSSSGNALTWGDQDDGGQDDGQFGRRRAVLSRGPAPPAGAGAPVGPARPGLAVTA